MRIFEIRASKSSKTSWIDAAHRWGLPGVDCPDCGSIWGTVGLEYPTVDLSGLPEELEYREARSASLESYRSLKRTISDAFPNLPVLLPGAAFGPLTGRASGKRLEGFVWRAWWSICLEADALEKLRKTGLNLPQHVKADITYRNEVQEVFELSLPLEGVLVNPVYDGIQLNHCTTCDRDSGTLPDAPLVDVSSISGTSDIFRIRNFTTIILVTEQFVEAVESQRITGAEFKQIATV